MAKVTSQFDYVIVYDPEAGFVTGEGWINSPPGAYPAQPRADWQRHLRILFQVPKGATVPSGNTEFQFHIANFNFASSADQWLIVSGVQAQYKGTGAANYGFLLTATDGQITAAGGLDVYFTSAGGKVGALCPNDGSGKPFGVVIVT